MLKVCPDEKMSVDKMSRHTLFKFCNYKRFISRSDKNGLILLSGEISNLNFGGN